jgi:hypothetical protein
MTKLEFQKRLIIIICIIATLGFWSFCFPVIFIFTFPAIVGLVGLLCYWDLKANKYVNGGL